MTAFCWLLYVSDESGAVGRWIITFLGRTLLSVRPAGSGKCCDGKAELTEQCGDPNGRELFYRSVEK